MAPSQFCAEDDDGHPTFPYKIFMYAHDRGNWGPDGVTYAVKRGPEWLATDAINTGPGEAELKASGWTAAGDFRAGYDQLCLRTDSQYRVRLEVAMGFQPVGAVWYEIADSVQGVEVRGELGGGEVMFFTQTTGGAPDIYGVPSNAPTHSQPPTHGPTWTPTPKPTGTPTPPPTHGPTWTPTPKPTGTPTLQPSPAPTSTPTVGACHADSAILCTASSESAYSGTTTGHGSFYGTNHTPDAKHLVVVPRPITLSATVCAGDPDTAGVVLGLATGCGTVPSVTLSSETVVM